MGFYINVFLNKYFTNDDKEEVIFFFVVLCDF
jgi:hypothetical protein